MNIRECAKQTTNAMLAVVSLSLVLLKETLLLGQCARHDGDDYVGLSSRHKDVEYWLGMDM